MVEEVAFMLLVEKIPSPVTDIVSKKIRQKPFYPPDSMPEGVRVRVRVAMFFRQSDGRLLVRD